MRLNLKRILFLPRVISPSSCFAQEGSASTYLTSYQWKTHIIINVMQNWDFKDSAPEPVHISLRLGEHDIDRGGSNRQGFCHVGRAPKKAVHNHKQPHVVDFCFTWWKAAESLRCKPVSPWWDSQPTAWSSSTWQFVFPTLSLKDQI